MLELLKSEIKKVRDFNTFDTHFQADNRKEEFLELSKNLVEDTKSDVIIDAKKRWEIVKEKSLVSFVYQLYSILRKQQQNHAGRKMFAHAYYLICSEPKMTNSQVIERIIKFAIDKKSVFQPTGFCTVQGVA